MRGACAIAAILVGELFCSRQFALGHSVLERFPSEVHSCATSRAMRLYAILADAGLTPTRARWSCASGSRRGCPGKPPARAIA
eukprot:252667-Pyramimonas_sp.AAC.1